jgi:hypothetical protein
MSFCHRWREFIAALGGGAVAWPVLARAAAGDAGDRRSMPAAWESLALAKPASGHMTFLVTEYGRPHSWTYADPAAIQSVKDWVKTALRFQT